MRREGKDTNTVFLRNTNNSKNKRKMVLFGLYHIFQIQTKKLYKNS